MIQTFKLITEAGDTEITFRFIEMECVGDSWVISAAYESEKPVDDTLAERGTGLRSVKRHYFTTGYDVLFPESRFCAKCGEYFTHPNHLHGRDCQCKTCKAG